MAGFFQQGLLAQGVEDFLGLRQRDRVFVFAALNAQGATLKIEKALAPRHPHSHRATGVAGKIALAHPHRAFDLLPPAFIAQQELMFDFNTHNPDSSE